MQDPHWGIRTDNQMESRWLFVPIPPFQNRRQSLRDTKWCAQEHTAYWGRAETQIQAGLLMGVLCSLCHVSVLRCTWHLFLPGTASGPGWSGTLLSSSLVFHSPFPFYFGSLPWWWCYFSVPFFLRHPRRVCLYGCVAFAKFTRDLWII